MYFSIAFLYFFRSKIIFFDCKKSGLNEIPSIPQSSKDSSLSSSMLPYARTGTGDRETLEQSLDHRILEYYRKVRKTGAGIAIFKNGACSGCHNAPSQPYTTLGCGWFINTCAFCHTLLIGYESGNQTQPNNIKTQLASHHDGEDVGPKNNK